MVKPALGRGLSALLSGTPAVPRASSPSSVTVTAPETVAPANPDGVRRLAWQQIRPCPFQPRKEFSEEGLRELADSIREKGIVQPLIVRPRGTDFELIAGERRWRAAQLAGLEQVPALVREADDRTVLELALIENLQRENLNPLEEALGFAQLIQEFHLTQEEAATRVGKSRAAVANSLRLLKLPEPVQQRVRTGHLSVGHAKVILGLGTTAEQQRAADRIMAQALNVRQTEEMIAQWRTPHSEEAVAAVPAKATNRDAHLADLENRLKQRLGTKVQLNYREGRGSIEVHYYSDAELERVLQIMGVGAE